jgi:hypothetical protein
MPFGRHYARLARPSLAFSVASLVSTRVVWRLADDFSSPRSATFQPVTGKNTSSYCLAPPHLSSYHHARTQADPSPRKDTSQHYLAPPPSLAIVSPRPSTSPNGAIIPTHRRRRTTHPPRKNASRHRLAPPQLSSYRHAYLYADRSPRQNISQRCSTTSRRI